jgi:hypothetical protein
MRAYGELKRRARLGIARGPQRPPWRAAEPDRTRPANYDGSSRTHDIVTLRWPANVRDGVETRPSRHRWQKSGSGATCSFPPTSRTPERQQPACQRGMVFFSELPGSVWPMVHALNGVRRKNQIAASRCKRQGTFSAKFLAIPAADRPSFRQGLVNAEGFAVPLSPLGSAMGLSRATRVQLAAVPSQQIVAHRVCQHARTEGAVI